MSHQAPLAAPLQTLADRLWTQYEEAAIQVGVAPVSHAELGESLTRVWVYSDWVGKTCVQFPQVLDDLTQSGDVLLEYAEDAYQQRLQALLEDVHDETTLAERLRLFRRREMLRIAIRDLAGWADLCETLVCLSRFADACVTCALQRLMAWACKAQGTPVGARSGEAQSMVVLGMGKLGARELNFSSDIDLIFAFPESGETQGGRVSISNEEFFTRLGRRLIHVLDKPTAQGVVFRVDMRLRPFGDSGPLVMSFDAMEDYYQSHGRDWERYAMVKARPVAGDVDAARQIMTLLSPFVYRRYLDYGAFESLREMKGLITQQVKRKGMEDNVKLGPGGIREVEFIGQVFQLIRAGRESVLRERGILKVLRLLVEKDLLPSFVADELTEAYVFLRHVENRLQAYADQQTHTLPKNELEQQRLAAAMGFAQWSVFVDAVRAKMACVHSHFEQVFEAPQTEHDQASRGTDYAAIWAGSLDQSHAGELLSDAGYVDAAEVIRLLGQLRESALYRGLSQRGRARMDQLMPLMIGAVVATGNPDITFKRVLNVIEAIGRRSAYFSLLVEHPMALSQLTRLCAASPWISEYVAFHPLLLDDLLDPRTLYAPLKRDTLARDLHENLRGIDADDLEQQMEALRHFAQSRTLRVAAADVAQVMPLMVVSDYLTDIAEEVLNAVLDLVWRHMTDRHGVPLCRHGDAQWSPKFAVVGYGKLGGIELGYGSDLDLVFLHNGEGDQGMTAGPKSIENGVFFARLGQRIIHVLNTRTPSGVVYEVDMRLRPSGASGLLVTSVESYAEYQRNDAWTWEHQALVRARVVAGDEAVTRQFNAIREEILSRERDGRALQKEVREMRERMRSELDSSKDDRFDLKQGSGGIADIEFIVQYLVLRWAHRYPELVGWTDNIRLLDSLGKTKVIGENEAAFLSEAYRQYRAEVHRLKLQEQEAIVDRHKFNDLRQSVIEIWSTYMA